MSDVFSRKKRSEVMSRIKSNGTRGEEVLHALIREFIGKRRRIERNVAGLPGRPDVVVPSLRLAVFADGCFYHVCPKHGHTPKSNRKYWIPKLEANYRRDKRSRRRLRELGYSVWSIWEHALRSPRLESTAKFL